MKHDIIVTIFHAFMEGETPHSPKKYGAFVGVSALSTRQEGVTVSNLLQGWIIEKECQFRKLVKIQLPEGVHKGEYNIRNVHLYGLHADCNTHDGMGQTVYVYCNPVQVIGGDIEGAIDAAINQGIKLSIPVGNGVRKEVIADILAVSTLYTDSVPEDWVPEF